MGSNFTYIDVVVVTSGPGTFTGLRVGIATAKAVAIAVDCPLLHYPTLDIMAEMRNENATMLRPLVVAGRGQVYTALYKGNKQIEIPEAANPEENHLIPEDNDDTLFFGNGTELFNKEYRNTLPDNIKFQDEILPLTPTLCKRALANLSLDNFKPEPLDITYLRSATS